MERKLKFLNGVMVFGIALSQAACKPKHETQTTPTESCPPISLNEGGQATFRWLQMEIGDEPFIFPLSAEDPFNPENQAKISIEEVTPNNGVSVIVDMPEKDPTSLFVENDLTGAMRFSPDIDLGVQFWACGDSYTAFFRLVPLQPLPSIDRT